MHALEEAAFGTAGDPAARLTAPQHQPRQLLPSAAAALPVRQPLPPILDCSACCAFSV